MTVALSSTRDDHVLTFRSIESQIVAFDYGVDVILQYSVILMEDTSLTGQTRTWEESLACETRRLNVKITFET